MTHIGIRQRVLLILVLASVLTLILVVTPLFSPAHAAPMAVPCEDFIRDSYCRKGSCTYDPSYGWWDNNNVWNLKIYATGQKVGSYWGPVLHTYPNCLPVCSSTCYLASVN